MQRERRQSLQVKGQGTIRRGPNDKVLKIPALYQTQASRKRDEWGRMGNTSDKKIKRGKAASVEDLHIYEKGNSLQ